MLQRVVSIGNVRFKVCSAHPEFWRSAEEFYRGFFLDSDSDPVDTLEINLVSAATVQEAIRNRPSRVFSARNGSLHLNYGNGYGVWDWSARRGRIVQAETDFHRDSPYNVYICDTLIRKILAYRLLEKRGILIHSASLIRGESAYLFVGPSGAGKSTVCRISVPTCKVLSDDLSLVTLSPQPALAHGTPFRGEYDGEAVNSHQKIAGIYLLRQAPYHKLVPAGRKLAVRELLRTVIFPDCSRPVAAKILNLVQELCEELPCYELYFAANREFWSSIDGN